VLEVPLLTETGAKKETVAELKEQALARAMPGGLLDQELMIFSGGQ